ncbi:MAG: outer membrane protein assembly factor BamA [Candidatus Sulfopaludibacter sp.]|nr:outer membrane protein assembly factor BamA [Candidatus Sulfopaludibacter sp.]
MRFVRRSSLLMASACLWVMSAPAFAQQQTPPPATPPQQPPAGQQQRPPATPPQQPPATPPQQPRNPFETVAPPTQPPAQQTPPGQSPLQPVRPTPGAQPAAAGQTITEIDFRGARRTPADMLKTLIRTRVGDVYNEEALGRDFMILYNSGRFDDIRLESEADPKGGIIIRWVVAERRVIRSIDYQGIHTVTVSEILDRFKERKVGLTVESQYDPNKVQRAAIVLKEFLSERGRQYATVDPVVEQIPPSSLKVTFNVNEGPKVKVGTITIDGNKAKNSRWVTTAMKNLHPYGIPHSIVFENMFAKTYDQAKLEEDKERIRQAYTDDGYFRATTLEETVTIVPRSGRGWRLPLLKSNGPGIFADIKLPVDEGNLYHLHAMNFVGVKLFRAPDQVLPQLFGMGVGSVFSTDKLRKGLENLRKTYGQFGYIDFVPEPQFEFPTNNQVDLTITADEGPQFFIRRIDFSGNSTTRDKVIRREILLDEGDMFNTQLWDLSILRLNQLGYFEMIKKEESLEGLKRNPQSNTVDITLKVRERGKNSIGLNGGVSGIAGSFVGFNYSTNNFLGLGETLSLSSQLGTLMRDVSLGFTEPYFLDRPLQLGFVVYLRRYSFDQAREASIFAGQNLIPLYNELGANNLLNYVQNSRGFNVSASYPLRHSFTRLSFTYGYDISNIVTQTSAAANYFQYINFSGVSGPNALQGIKTSHITPALQYNTVNHPINPTGGKSLYFSVDFASSLMGGNVNTIRPAIDAKYFHLSPWSKKHVIGIHATTSIISGYGGKEIPPFARTFIGGEQDVRGFDFFGITPIAYIASSAPVNVLNNDGSPRTQRVVSGGQLTSVPVTMQVPIYQLITPGGDWQTVTNFEYRIPIIGPVTMAIFADTGLNRILLPGQLKMDPSRVQDLNNQFPQAGFSGKVLIAPGTERMRVSTGIEFQVMLPVVQAPFRVYFAWNPSRVFENLQTPIVADRAAFPNNATFLQSVASFGQIYPFDERRTLFRFTIGRTF